MQNVNAKLHTAVTIGAALCILSLSVHADGLAENQTRLGAISGDVGLLTQGAVEWIEPQVGLPVETGDHLRTGEDGHVEILTGENVVWALSPNSEIVLEHIVVNSGRFNLVYGTMQGILDSVKLAGLAQDWILNTPAAELAIRGTDFAVVVSKSEGTRLAVFEGIVEMEPAESAEGREPPVRVSGHHEAVAARGKSIQLSSTYSAAMRPWEKARPTLKRRLRTNQNTWSPFTPALRKELRLKYVAPVSKRKKAKPVAPRTRRKSQPQN